MTPVQLQEEIDIRIRAIESCQNQVLYYYNSWNYCQMATMEARLIRLRKELDKLLSLASTFR